MGGAASHRSGSEPYRLAARAIDTHTRTADAGGKGGVPIEVYQTIGFKRVWGMAMPAWTMPSSYSAFRELAGISRTSLIYGDCGAEAKGSL